MTAASVAFNLAVRATNTAHAAARVAAKGAVATSDSGRAFWAGVLYAHQQNKITGAAAELLVLEGEDKPAKSDTIASLEGYKPATSKRGATKRSAK